MKAVTRRRFGSPDNIRIKEVDRPIPKKDEILVKIHYASVTRGDAIMMKLPTVFMYVMRLIIGYRKKSIFGSEYAGTIVEKGDEVSKFQIGDEVYGTTTYEKSGGQAEYIRVNADGIVVKKPNNISFKEAATLPVGAMTALYLLEKNGIEKTKTVMIYGASGSVGTFAVQIAKYFDTQVTGVASARNQELVASLGADLVLDYTADEFSRHDNTYDILFDTVGKLSKSDRKRFLSDNGRFISNMATTKELTSLLTKINEMVGEGKLKSVIDKEYKLDDIVEAYHYVNTGRKRGNIAILVNEE